MKAHGFQNVLAKFLVLVVATVMCGMPEVVQAQQQDQQQQQSGTTVDPSKGPLQPIPAQNQPTDNNAQAPAESSTDASQATPPPQPKAEPQMQQPLGAATAEGVATVGGAASRPAGEAIAPDKQRQRRSLLLKMGLIAAAGVAIGTVAGLSKGTSAKPGGVK